VRALIGLSIKNILVIVKQCITLKKSILDIIDIYTMHYEYKEKNISLTSALAHNVKINNCFWINWIWWYSRYKKII